MFKNENEQNERRLQKIRVLNKNEPYKKAYDQNFPHFLKFVDLFNRIVVTEPPFCCIILISPLLQPTRAGKVYHSRKLAKCIVYFCCVFHFFCSNSSIISLCCSGHQKELFMLTHRSLSFSHQSCSYFSVRCFP